MNETGLTLGPLNKCFRLFIRQDEDQINYPFSLVYAFTQPETLKEDRNNRLSLKTSIGVYIWDECTLYSINNMVPFNTH